MPPRRARPASRCRPGALPAIAVALVIALVGCRRESTTDGALASPALPAQTLVWLDRRGQPVGQLDVPPPIRMARVSPDGARLAWLDGEGRLWVRPLQGGAVSRVNAGTARGFAWAPDSKAVVVDATDPTSRMQILDPDAHSDRPLSATGVALKPTDWSSDGLYITYEQDGGPKQSDVWLLYLKDEGTPLPQAYSNGADSDGMFSPDSRSLAYVSAPDGRAEVFVKPFPVPGIATRISNNGGTAPRWRRDGKELFYQAADGLLMVATIDHAPHATLLSVEALFPMKGTLQQPSSDGQRFLILTP